MNDSRMMKTILHDAAVALEAFDFTRLERLERQLAELEARGVKLEREDAGTILQKMGLLEIFLQNCHANLNTLKQLHTRNAGISWVR